MVQEPWIILKSIGSSWKGYPYFYKMKNTFYLQKKKKGVCLRRRVNKCVRIDFFGEN